MNQKKAPLFEGLKKHWEANPVSGHVPGHKYGQVFPEIGYSYFQEILKLDATEISGLDDLHDPEGMIDEAQRLAANYYGAEATFFLVNGSTVGNLAMILAACQRGSKVLVQRNCHKSILHGVELAGADPIFLSCETDSEVGVATHFSLKELREALDSVSGIEAVVLTNPNYYGHSYEMKEIIDLVHRYNVPVLVDEAHGAHFTVGEGFPNSALDCGADVVVHSAHKTLPAMTMGSYLHINGERVKKEKLAYYLKMLQSSSPSYPIMASLDLARYYLASFDKQAIQELLHDMEDLQLQIGKMPEIRVVVPKNKLLQKDPLKLVLRSTQGISGFSLQKLLEKEGIFVELADAKNVLLVLPLAINDRKQELLEKLTRAVLHQHEKTPEVEIVKLPTPPNGLGQLAIPLGEQENYKAVKCHLEEAVGKVAAESIIPYPPGIPVVLKGERVTASIVEYLKQLVELGARFQGNEQLYKGYMNIYKEKE
ncbi:aminotransferase class I/II-fold pyridoxal phosphate-dependent enzyme [Bacillus sp. THAF10]|uniref:aminotransferase class I/II-fold pyridoxal phosphate-dependent enzyme n=1 Tax=Bacillus sp. THAF10 TaxID=2587848 RepID=UPI0012695801|nr:aminotransferase class I/II-fold pyridoxal phosphate-dependent enzyme [Bacillus sp. THAF10]